MKWFKKTNKKSGQVLLITIMLLATVLTVVVSIAFKSTNETQITKLEEESQKALAAAETGIENALQQGRSITLSDVPNQLTDISTLNATVTTAVNSTVFSTPYIAVDQQYTFYMADYNGSGSLTNSYAINGNQYVTLYYGSDTITCDSIAEEITFITGSTNTRYMADTGNLVNTSANQGNRTSSSKDGISFNCKTNALNIPVGTTVMLVRNLKNGTRMAIEMSGNGNVKTQGKTVISEATTTTGVAKRVQLFQSYPQIPADFYVTSF